VFSLYNYSRRFDLNARLRCTEINIESLWIISAKLTVIRSLVSLPVKLIRNSACVPCLLAPMRESIGVYE
jgi:hypothetical protein